MKTCFCYVISFFQHLLFGDFKFFSHPGLFGFWSFFEEQRDRYLDSGTYSNSREEKTKNPKTNEPFKNGFLSQLRNEFEFQDPKVQHIGYEISEQSLSKARTECVMKCLNAYHNWQIICGGQDTVIHEMCSVSSSVTNTILPSLLQ